MKNYPLPQVFAAFSVSIGTFIFGIFLGWSAPIIPKLLQNSQLNLSSLDVAWIVSVLPLGECLSCVPAGMIRNRFGTKALIEIYSIANIFGWILMIFSRNSWMLILARFLCGIAGGGFLFIVPIYIGEISSKSIRGTLASLTEVNMKFGVTFVYTIASFLDLQHANIVFAFVALTYLIISFFLPESPVYLLNKGRIEEAKKSLRTLQRNDKNIQDELGELQVIQPKAQTTLSDELKNAATRKAFVIIIVMFVLFQSCGVNAIMFYSTKILIDSGLNFDPFVSTILLGFVQILAVISAMILVDYKGRKFLLIISFIIMTFGLIVNAVFFHLKSLNFEFPNFRWISFAGVVIYIIGFNSGIGTVIFILMSEIFSSSAKKVVAPLGMTTNFFTSFLVTFTFPLISANVGMHLMFYFFALSCIVGIIFTWKFIPETKGKSLNEIQKMLEGEETICNEMIAVESELLNTC